MGGEHADWSDDLDSFVKDCDDLFGMLRRRCLYIRFVPCRLLPVRKGNRVLLREFQVWSPKSETPLSDASFWSSMYAVQDLVIIALADHIIAEDDESQSGEHDAT